MRIATVPGTTMVKTIVLRIAQNLRCMWQDSRPNLTVKSKAAEEHQDAAATSSRVDPDNSIHLYPRG
jgi:hypothetical protein